MKHLLTLLIMFFLAATACAAQECKVSETVGPNCMKIPNGFKHVQLQGKDSRVGEIRGQGVVITYDDYARWARSRNGSMECTLPPNPKRVPYLAKVLHLPG